MVTLRPYQVEAVNSIEQEWAKGNKKTLLVSPTASGKTTMFGALVSHQIKDGSRALIIAHRGELLEQARNRLKTAFGIDSSLEKAESTAIGSSNLVTLGSIQTLSNPERLNKFSKDYFKTIVVDEAHHSLAPSYQTVLKHFEGANIVGCTATPDLKKPLNLGTFYESKAYEYTMHRAIKEGYLCPIKALMIPLKLDIKNVSISNGDYAVNEVGHALEPYLESIAKEMASLCQNRKTVVFLPLIDTSVKFTSLLNRYGLKAVEVNGNSKDREQILSDFEKGKYQVLCNSMLLTEGRDAPLVDCVVVLRPTKVRSLYQQMVGRGMRLAPNKDHLLLLDFLWLTERHDLCKPSSLLAKSEEEAKRIDKKVEASASAIDLVEAEAEVGRDIIAEREESLKNELEAMRKKKRQLVDPVQYAFSISEEDLATYEPTFDWERKEVTSKQKEYLEKHGIYPDDIECSGLASLIIEKLKNRQVEGLATPRQIRLLEKYGFKHVGVWDFDEASRLISLIASHSWKLPRFLDPEKYEPKKGAN